MNRTIQVTGTGQVSVRPDLTEISFTLKASDEQYDAASDKAAAQLYRLQKALSEVGFPREELKTTNYRVATEYENERDENGCLRNVFVGYSYIHSLKLSFDFDMERLSRVLYAVAHSVAEPELTVEFTVKNRDAVSEELLKNATENAREKAKILAAASDVRLGLLLSVKYHWEEPDLTSPSRFSMDWRCMAMNRAVPVSVTPEDITVEDSVSFEWEILPRA